MKRLTQSGLMLAGLLLVSLSLGLPGVQAQPGGDEEMPSAREQAAFDPTGYWVSVVTEDWRWRMVVPPVGDIGSIPLNQAGREVANEWQPSGDDLLACELHGGAAIMRQPGRIHITWQDDETLRMDFSAGSQTRLLHFEEDGDAGAMGPSRQGYTTAHWFKQPQSRGLGFGGGRVSSFEGGSLRSETSNLLPGLLQANGVPYSAETTVEEFYHLLPGPTGEDWLVVTTEVTDPVYLNQTYIISNQFRREDDGSSWDPTQCR